LQVKTPETPTFTPTHSMGSSRKIKDLYGRTPLPSTSDRSSAQGTSGAPVKWEQGDTDTHTTPLPTLRTPPNRHLPPSDPLSAPFGQMLTLGNQTLMDRTSQHRDAVPADLVAEVLTGDADGTGAGRTQDIHIQVVPLLSRDTRRDRAECGHKTDTSTSVLLTTG